MELPQADNDESPAQKRRRWAREMEMGADQCDNSAKQMELQAKVLRARAAEMREMATLLRGPTAVE